MIGKINPLAGKLVPVSMLVDVPKLITAYYDQIPNPAEAKERVVFGTSGHRGSSFDSTFNEWHILAITQAICLFRNHHHITGPLFLGVDTHALSVPAFSSALEVLAANDVDVMIAADAEYTPTPVISHAILAYNKNRTEGLADGIVITPSHNPPRSGGFKYNPPNGGPAELDVTNWIQNKANDLLKEQLKGVKRIPFAKALSAKTTHHHDYITPYVDDLKNVINMDVLRESQIHIGVDPLGGAGIHYWQPIAERYKLNLTIVNTLVDSTFRFMTLDWDGQVRMDPASPYAMVNLIKLKNKFDIAFACDTDHDRHGIVTPHAGLITPNHYLAVAILYLFQHRPKWPSSKAVSKTVVCSQMLDWVSASLNVSMYEVPVGFKWFVNGLLDGSLGFCGEQSAGAVFDRLDGAVWTTDKDGMVPGLLAAEITAVLQKDIGDIYHELENKFGKTFYERSDTKATAEQKALLAKITPQQVKATKLVGDKIEKIINHAPGNNEPIGGIKVISKNGWFVARPSGTEDIYEIIGESFLSAEHLQKILGEAQKIVDDTLHAEVKSETE